MPRSAAPPASIWSSLWERMGIADEIKKKGIPQKSGAEVASRVAEGNADIGLTLMGEIAPIRGAALSASCRRPTARTPPTPPA